jgi:hypothetical protein
VTDEFGRFSMRDLSIGGISTAAQAAATTRRTSFAMSQRAGLVKIIDRKG